MVMSIISFVIMVIVIMIRLKRIKMMVNNGNDNYELIMSKYNRCRYI